MADDLKEQGMTGTKFNYQLPGGTNIERFADASQQAGCCIRQVNIIKTREFIPNWDVYTFLGKNSRCKKIKRI